MHLNYESVLIRPPMQERLGPEKIASLPLKDYGIPFDSDEAGKVLVRFRPVESKQSHSQITCTA